MANKVGIFDLSIAFNRDVTTQVTKEDKVIYNVRDKVVKTGEGEYDFIVEEEVYEESRCDRDEYIESFSDEVGVENILKKVKLTGDASLLDQVTPQYGDFRNMPSNNMEADEALLKGKAAADAVGIQFTEDELNKYIQAEVQKIIDAKAQPVESENK